MSDLFSGYKNKGGKADSSHNKLLGKVYKAWYEGRTFQSEEEMAEFLGILPGYSESAELFYNSHHDWTSPPQK